MLHFRKFEEAGKCPVFLPEDDGLNCGQANGQDKYIKYHCGFFCAGMELEGQVQVTVFSATKAACKTIMGLHWEDQLTQCNHNTWASQIL